MISIADQQSLERRFESYEAIRAEGPVYRDPVSGFFVVTQMEDVRAIAMDTARFSNKTNMLVGRSSGSSSEIAHMYKERGYPQVDTLSSNDPPSHKLFRSIVDRSFRPARVAKMAEYMNAVINELVDGFENDRRIEFVEQYAVLLPMIVIADQMGVGRAQMGDFKRWSDAVMATSNTLTTPDEMVESAKSIIELQQFLAARYQEARREPRQDIISDIATAEIDGRPLEMKEMVSLGLTLLVAGNETTTNGLGSAMLRLIETGAEQSIRSDPARAKAFVEEVLRLDCPIQLLYRRATEDVAYKGVSIPNGSIVQLVWAAANRDCAHFSDPSLFRLERTEAARHVTFGSGIHFCVGNALARAEMVATLQILTNRLRNIRIENAPDAVVHHLHTLAYGPRRLVLNFDKA